MKYLVGTILIIIGIFHGIHILQVDYGSITNLNLGGAFSFSNLDRVASSGIIGKSLVLAFNLILIVLGILEIRSAVLNRKLKYLKRN